MDDVETGYYSELSSSDMSNSIHNTTNQSTGPTGDPRPSEPTQSNPEPAEPVETELISGMNEIYSLDRGKTKLYKEFLKLYSDSDEGQKFAESDSFERGQTRRKLLLWLLIIVLISNPILGGYNLHHFTSYFNNFTTTQLSKAFPQNTEVTKELSKKWYQFSFNTQGVSSQDTVNTNPVDPLDNPRILEFKRVCDEISVRIRRYSFYEVFGEIIFGIFSLVLMSLCKLPCNNGNSIRFMMPMLFILYMLIYRFLAFYILFTTLKIGFYSLVTLKPRVLQLRKVFGRSDLNFYSSNDGGFKLFRNCFSRDTFSSSDPHEKYIHSLYNYASDIGTYLKNIDVGDYSQGLDDLTNKFKNRKLNY
uniref:Uncharacterized protein n=1 Tax=Theileria parva TaxID=5875 RepID=Q4N448_THEPA|eukprot:XP_765358.1 hypothetical protein [Theileria parva strain Muguga]